MEVVIRGFRSNDEPVIHDVTVIWADTRTWQEIPGRARSPRYKRSHHRSVPARRLRVLSYRVIPDVPFQLAAFVSGLLADHRREIGTRDGTRALTCWKQAVFALAWFRDRPDIRRSAPASGSRRPPPTGTRTRPSRCSPRRPPPCARPWTGPSSRDFPTYPRRHAHRLRPLRGQENQQEGERDRQMVLREGVRPRRERAGARRTRRRAAVGLGRPARQHPDLTAARELVLPRGPAVPERPAVPGRFRL